MESAFDIIEMPGAFFTGYYEPLLDVSPVATGKFRTPIHRRPANFARVAPQPHLPGDGTYAMRIGAGDTAPLPDRGAVMDGALDGQGLEIAYAADPIDAFFAHVQGSATLRFPDGARMRIGYHGKSGHPYTAVGKTLIQMGHLTRETVSMQSIRAVLGANPDLIRPVLGSNASYIFFRERAWNDAGPVAAGGVPLRPLRSIAVDRNVWGLGTPMHANLTLPDGTQFAQTVIAEDCGSAIVGAARADLFCGTGQNAGDIAGRLATRGTLTAFVPKAWLR